jgi:hypothetical protein
MGFKVEPKTSSGVIFRYVCPRCGSGKFDLLSLGIPGTGASVCLNCRLPLAVWAHEPPQALNTASSYLVP